MNQPHRTDESFLADQAAQDWSNVLIRSATACPTNIDALLAGKPRKPGKVVFAAPPAPPRARELAEADRPAIGVLLDDAAERMPDADAASLAARYAALAIEKECDIIILSHQANAGFERFGFRVERVAGQTATAREACIDGLRRFWGIEVMI